MDLQEVDMSEKKLYELSVRSGLTADGLPCATPQLTIDHQTFSLQECFGEGHWSPEDHAHQFNEQLSKALDRMLEKNELG